MRASLAALAGAAMWVLGACQTAAAPATPQPAVLVKPSAKTLKTVSKAAASAMGDMQVKLAPDVLTKSSTLTLETQMRPSLNTRQMAGRMNDRARPRPEHFDLMKEGRACYLIHRKSGAKLPLKGVKCTLP